MRNKLKYDYICSLDTNLLKLKIELKNMKNRKIYNKINGYCEY